MKTTNELLSIIYMVCKTYLQPYINGNVFKEVRNTTSKNEDCVIRVIPGTTGKFSQNGAINIKLYFQGLFSENTFYPNTIRAAEMESLLYSISEMLLKLSDIHFDIESRVIKNIPLLKGDNQVENEYVAILTINYIL